MGDTPTADMLLEFSRDEQCTPPLAQPRPPSPPPIIRMSHLTKAPSECAGARMGVDCHYALQDIQRYIPDVHSVGYYHDLTKSVTHTHADERGLFASLISAACWRGLVLLLL